MEWDYWCQPWGFKGLVTYFFVTPSPCPAFPAPHPPHHLQPTGFEIASSYSSLDELKKRGLLRLLKKKPWLSAASHRLRRMVCFPVLYSVFWTHLCLYRRMYQEQCSYHVRHSCPTHWSDMRPKLPRWLPAFSAYIVWEGDRISEGWAVIDSIGPWNHIPKVIDEARISAAAGGCMLVLQMFCCHLLINSLQFCFFIFNHLISFFPSFTVVIYKTWL